MKTYKNKKYIGGVGEHREHERCSICYEQGRDDAVKEIKEAQDEEIRRLTSGFNNKVKK